MRRRSLAMALLTATVATVRRRIDGELVEETAADLIAAEYRHTVARGVLAGDPPDPQLHSHVVVTSAVRDDGRVVAVASRPVFRAARELGAFYRLALADELRRRGYSIEAGTGRQARYFEIAGVPRSLADAFSARSREVARAAERFRAKWGREPERGELRRLKLENRQAKTLQTRGDLQRAWNETAARFEVSRRRFRLAGLRGASLREGPLEDRVEGRLTERAATFQPGEFRSVLFEQAVESSPRARLWRPRSVRRAPRAATARRPDDHSSASCSRAGDRGPCGRLASSAARGRGEGSPGGERPGRRAHRGCVER